MEKVEQIKPNKDIIEIIKTILHQHEKILVINSKLVESFSAPRIIHSINIPDLEGDEENEKQNCY